MNVSVQNKNAYLFIYPEGAHNTSINLESENIFSSAGNVFIESIFAHISGTRTFVPKSVSSIVSSAPKIKNGWVSVFIVFFQK